MPRILVVDDDKAVRSAIETVLSHAGHDVVIADSGHSAVAALSAGSVDVVLVDIFMPGMDGLEAIRALRERAPQVPVVAMSGYLARETDPAGPDFLHLATKLGALRGLHKPFRPKELLEVVKDCLEESASDSTINGSAA